MLIGRNDVVYVDAAGNVWNNAAADRTAVINTPGGGASRSTRRPDLVPGVDPFIKDGGLLFLNPAAFSTPLPGTFGNLERNSIHGPGFKQIDMVLGKQLSISGRRNAEFRAEIFNLFNITNFANPIGTLPNAIPTGNAGTAPPSNTVQPGQPYSTAAAGTSACLDGYPRRNPTRTVAFVAACLPRPDLPCGLGDYLLADGQ